MRKNTIRVKAEPIEYDLLKVVFSFPLRKGEKEYYAAETDAVIGEEKTRWTIFKNTCLEVNLSENSVVYKPVTEYPASEYAKLIQEKSEKGEEEWFSVRFEDGASADIWPKSIKSVEVVRRKVKDEEALERQDSAAVVHFAIQRGNGDGNPDEWKKMVETFLDDFKDRYKRKILRFEVDFRRDSRGDGCDFHCRMFTRPRNEKDPMRFLLNAENISRYLLLTYFEWTLEKEKYLKPSLK